MQMRVLVGAAAAFAVAAVVLPSVGGAAAPSPYTLSCVIGGITSTYWKHEKLEQVTLEWSAPGATFAPLVEPVLSATPPRGFVVTGTPSSGGLEPVSATATFQHTDGSTEQISTTCG